MRTTVDLPSWVHRRASQLAQQRGESLSRTVAQLTERGLAQLSDPVTVYIDAGSGFPIVRFGRTITGQDDEADLDE